MHFNGNSWKQFCVKEMDRNGPIKSSPQRPIRSGASLATCILGFSGIFPENAFDWLVGSSRAFPAIIDWLVVPVWPVH